MAVAVEELEHGGHTLAMLSTPRSACLVYAELLLVLTTLSRVFSLGWITEIYYLAIDQELTHTTYNKKKLNLHYMTLGSLDNLRINNMFTKIKP